MVYTFLFKVTCDCKDWFHDGGQCFHGCLVLALEKKLDLKMETVDIRERKAKGRKRNALTALFLQKDSPEARASKKARTDAPKNGKRLTALQIAKRAAARKAAAKKAAAKAAVANAKAKK